LNLPFDEARTESRDDALARRDATLEWYGGEPSAEYLAARKLLAEQEARKWLTPAPQSKSKVEVLAEGVPDTDVEWINIGPTGGLANGRPAAGGENESGRISIQGIVTHPTNAQILYLATSAGGVWKTTQAGPDVVDWNWVSITDALPHDSGSGNLACGALAMNPGDSETLYLGLGDFWSTTGRGLYKTTNGGGNWTELGAIGNTRRVMSILPATANVILVGGDAGLWRSTNSGANFVNIPINGDAGGNIWSIQKLTNSNLILSKENARGPAADAGVGSLWYSTDSGATWNAAQMNVPDWAQNKLGRMTLAAAPSSDGVGYAFAQLIQTPYIFYFIPTSDPQAFLPGLLRTADGGVSWNFIPALGASPFDEWRQSSYNQALAVSPDNANLVYAGGNTSFARTWLAGVFWEQLTQWQGWTRAYAHADFQTAAFSKAGPTTLFVGNDGGLTVFWRPNAAFAEYPQGAEYVNPDARYVDNRHNGGIVTHNVYNIGSTYARNSVWKVSAGMQDNGTRLRRGPAPGTTLYDETSYSTGDGFGTLYHRFNANKLLISSYYTNIYRSTDSGTNFVQTFSSSSSLLAPFYTRLHPGLFDATGRTVFTHTAWFIYRSDDFGANWVADVPGAIFLGKSVRNFNVSKSNRDSRAMVLGKLPRLLGATAAEINGVDVLVTHDAGQSWKFAINPPAGDPNRRGLLSYVWFKTDDDNVLYMASVALNAQRHHLFKSVNGGQDWASIDGNPGAGNGLPYGIPVHVIQNDPTDPDTLLAGTDFGVYMSRNGGTTWERYGQGMPLVSVTDLYIAPDSSFVRAATFGRGVWQIGEPGDGEEGGGGED
jgi:photosystem II stability/assembly factor-like uncharacterized protein